jgi:hypothetical protein
MHFYLVSLKVAKVLLPRFSICSHNSCQSTKFELEHVSKTEKLDKIFGSCQWETATATSGYTNLHDGSWVQVRNRADKELVVVVNAHGFGEL